MPLFVIERFFAESLELTKADVDGVTAINDETGVTWLFSFLSADKRKTYCLYESPSAEALRAAAERLGVPADTIVEVGEIGPYAPAVAAARAQLAAV